MDKMGEIKLVVVVKLKQIKRNEAKGVSAHKMFVYKEGKLRKIIWLKSGSVCGEDWGK